jgi:predicted nuclease of predicted toxin-antitoxin system
VGSAATGAPVRLALDHHSSHLIAERLRDRGHDVVAVSERGWHRCSDEELLDRCAAENRVLLTNDVGDFVAIAQRWAAEGRSHAGLVFTSDVSLPRTRATIGTYVELLGALLREHPEEPASVDRIHWL